jgi:hypothetical protein
MTRSAPSGTLERAKRRKTMTGTFHLIRDLFIAFALVIALAVVAWIAIDYGAAVIVALGGFALVALIGIPIVAMYEEEHDLPFNAARR